MGDDIDPSTLPVECSLAVYATDAEIDELVQAVVADLGISMEDPSNGFYQHLIDQYRERVGSE